MSEPTPSVKDLHHRAGRSMACLSRLAADSSAFCYQPYIAIFYGDEPEASWETTGERG